MIEIRRNKNVEKWLKSEFGQNAQFAQKSKFHKKSKFYSGF